MSRPLLDESRLHPDIRDTVEHLHAEVVHNVQAASISNAVLVVGMAGNPFCKRARKAPRSGSSKAIWRIGKRHPPALERPHDQAVTGARDQALSGLDAAQAEHEDAVLTNFCLYRPSVQTKLQALLANSCIKCATSP